MISENYINRLLRRYMATDEGRTRVEEYMKAVTDKGFVRSEIDARLAEIATRLYEAISAKIPSFARSRDSIQVTAPKYRKNQGMEAKISVDEDALHRESLHYMNRQEYMRSGSLKISAGRGVYDIVGLFTHGYEVRGKRPYGFWVHEGGDSEERIGARMRRDPDPFLRELTDKLNSEYAGVCEITLSDNYIH